MAEFEFWVNGMTCEHCERAVASELIALPGIVDVRADAASGHVVLSHDTPLDLGAMEAAIEDAGYTVRSWRTATNA